jgi:hypothetical protein
MRKMRLPAPLLPLLFAMRPFDWSPGP